MFSPERGNGNREGGVDRSEVIAKSVRDFVQENGMTAQQVEDAYFICIDRDTTNAREEISDERVLSLAKRFSDAEQEGLALNKIGSIVSAIRRTEDAPETYRSFIDKLRTSDRDRKVLLSIFEKNRVGEIRFIDPKTLEYIVPMAMRLPKSFQSLSAEIRAEQLADVLSLFMNQIGNRDFGVEFSDEG